MLGSSVFWNPGVFFCDKGSYFRFDKWKTLPKESGVAVKLSGVQHHNGISVNECYHAPLRNIHSKILEEYPDIPQYFGLKTAVKAVNDTAGPEGLVLSFRVFETIL